MAAADLGFVFVFMHHFQSTPFFVRSLLQMAVLEIQSNGDSSYVSQEAINSAIQSLEDPLQRVSRGEQSTSTLYSCLGERLTV